MLMTGGQIAETLGEIEWPRVYTGSVELDTG